MSAPVSRSRAASAALAALALVVAAHPAMGAAAVLAWRDGTTLHLTNDAAAVPAEGSVRRYESRAPVRPAVARPPAAQDAGGTATLSPERSPAAPYVGSGAPHTFAHRVQPVGASPVATHVAAPPSRVAAPPILIAPTIVVRAPETQVTVVIGDGWPAGAYAGWPYAPTGFAGHEHPQMPFLAGRRLVRHSHFFARGRDGLFTPWGHFSSNGLLVPSVASY